MGKMKKEKTKCDECEELRVCSQFNCIQNDEQPILCRACRREHMNNCICSTCVHCGREFKRGETVIDDSCYNTAYLHEGCVAQYHISQSDIHTFT